MGIIYGGTHIDEDFRDRSVADQWFEDKFNQRMAAKDMEVTTKYRYDPKFNTGVRLVSITPPWMAIFWRLTTALSTGAMRRAKIFTNVLS